MSNLTTTVQIQKTQKAQREKKQIQLQHCIKTLHRYHPQNIKSLASTDPQAQYSPTTSHQHNKSTPTTKGAGGKSQQDSCPTKTTTPWWHELVGCSGTCNGGTGHFSLNRDACVNGTGFCVVHCFEGGKKEKAADAARISGHQWRKSLYVLNTSELRHRLFTETRTIQEQKT